MGKASVKALDWADAEKSEVCKQASCKPPSRRSQTQASSQPGFEWHGGTAQWLSRLEDWELEEKLHGCGGGIGHNAYRFNLPEAPEQQLANSQSPSRHVDYGAQLRWLDWHALLG